jgi:hypothetical protein
MAVWHYPAFRLLNTGLMEEASFEMFLYTRLTGFIATRMATAQVPLSQPELNDGQQIPFLSAFRRFVRDR